ncbi:AMP-binding protein [Saccharothrix sp. BKS2]|uniref:AMP-binding protein n=1 Tax=Saccharothrix sp. BKS2 TaxID=3064400 RepID=UPI0039ED950D
MTQVEEAPVREAWSGPLRARSREFLRTAPAHARPAHQSAAEVRCDRPLDPRVLERALADVTAWHPDLLGRAPAPGHAVLPGERPLVVREVVVADEAEASEALAAHAATPLDLADGPLFAVLLVTLPCRSSLGLVAHRLVCDQGSLMEVVERLAQRYEVRATTTGPAPDPGPAVLPPAGPATPVDGPPGNGPLLDVLHEELRDVPLDVALPGMRPRRAVPGYGCAHHRVDLDRELVDGVRSLAERFGVPTAVVHLAAFRALLHRFARQDAVLVMAELDRRPAGAGPGCWTDLVPLALTGARDLRFADLVPITGRRLDEARDHLPAAVPELARRLHQDAAGAGSTLGRVSFAVRPADRALTAAGAGWTCRVVEPPAGEFDLGLVLREGDGDAACHTATFAYDPDLLPAWAVATTARSFLHLLRSATAAPDDTITDLDLVDPLDRRILLEDWNGPADLVPVTSPVPALFEARAAAHPDAPAVRENGVTHTYAQLNAGANRVAHTLLARGVRKGDVVGVYVPRSVEWVVGYLAAYKIGAVVVALDPGSPQSRLEAAIAASPPAAVVATSSVPDSPAIGNAGAVRVDVDSAEVRRHPAADPGVPIGLDDPAYVVQTSGSTGRPRAVFGVHRAHAHLALQVAAVMRITPDSHMSWLVDAAAGISISLVWRTLCAGATLHIAGDDELVSPVRLRQWHLDNGITHTFVTTQLAAPLTALEWPDDCPLGVMEVGGEKVRRWAPAELPFEVVVAYGSNEAFLVTSMLFPWEHRVTARTATEDDRRQPPPVGRPLPGVHVYVVDADLRLLPPGVVGEVCVDSPEMMLGYLGEPEETARRVRPNPFGPPGSRLLWTGDIGSVRPDGMLELTGRLDDMVKVRGFRVEPAAVEAILVDHPAVRAAAVVAVADAAGHHQLVACFVPERPVTPEALRAHMLDHAPAYMVPIAYVPMERLPMGVLNKVDRKRLPPEDWSAHRPRASYRAPATPDEAVLTRIWAEVLEDDRVGADDDLVEMGGSSLHVGRVQVRILEQLGVEVGIRQIFETPTPRAIAAVLRREDAPRRRPLPPVLSRGARSRGDG